MSCSLENFSFFLLRLLPLKPFYYGHAGNTEALLLEQVLSVPIALESNALRKSGECGECGKSAPHLRIEEGLYHA